MRLARHSDSFEFQAEQPQALLEVPHLKNEQMLGRAIVLVELPQVVVVDSGALAFDRCAQWFDELAPHLVGGERRLKGNPDTVHDA